MALDTTAQSGRWAYLVHVELDSTTLYFSNVPAIVDNQPYDARLLSTPNVSTQLSDILNPKQVVSSINLRLRNEDQVIRGYFTDYTWGNRVVKIYIGEGESLSSGYSLVFEGTVRFPNGLRWDENSATVSVNDRRAQDSKVLPIESQGMGNTLRYETAEFPTLDENFLTDPKQILLGDWSSSVGSQRVKAVCVDTGTKEFRLAGHPIQQIESVYKKGGLSAATSVSFSSPNLTDASFILDVAYDPARDVIFAHCKGAETSNSTLIEAPSEVLKYILNTHLGVTLTKLNLTSFASVASNLTYVFRRHIVQNTASIDLLEELAREAGFDIFIKEGQYFIQTSTVSTDPSGLSTFKATDIVPGSFEVVNDAENNYFNSLSIGYKYNPQSGHYKSYDDESSSAIAGALANIHREFQFEWMYVDSDVENRAQNLLQIFSQEPMTVNITLKNRALLHYIADRLYLDYANERDGVTYVDDVPYQIRKVDIQPDEMAIKLTMWDISALLAFGTWMADSAPAWSAATEPQRNDSGFWTDDDGFIDPADARSQRSLWAPEPS